jgi:hypothetical protein
MPNLKEDNGLIVLSFACMLQDSPNADSVLPGFEGSSCAISDLQISSWF